MSHVGGPWPLGSHDTVSSVGGLILLLSGELNSRAPSLSCDRLDLGFGLGLTLIRSSFLAVASFLLEMNSSRSA